MQHLLAELYDLNVTADVEDDMTAVLSNLFSFFSQVVCCQRSLHCDDVTGEDQ